MFEINDETASGDDFTASNSGQLTPFQQEVISLFISAAAALALPKSLGEIYGLFFSTEEPLADKDLLALKRLEVISEQTASITQAAAAKLATETIDALKTTIAILKAPAKPKATYSAAAAGKQK